MILLGIIGWGIISFLLSIAILPDCSMGTFFLFYALFIFVPVILGILVAFISACTENKNEEVQLKEEQRHKDNKYNQQSETNNETHADDTREFYDSVKDNFEQDYSNDTFDDGHKDSTNNKETHEEYQTKSNMPNEYEIQICYEILGCKETATDQELRKAYLSLCKEYHPDRIQGASEGVKKLANEQLRKIIDAYEKLKMARGI